jgi:predicted transposase YdaD
MAKTWDSILKLLVGSNPQDFVSLLLPGAQYLGVVERELHARSIEADLLYRVARNGLELILHVEFQRRRDPEMGRRLWEYNAQTTIMNRVPVWSFVIYLVRDGVVAESPYQVWFSDIKMFHEFHYDIIKLWELSSDELEQPGREGLLPLLPLTKNGGNREQVDEMFARLRAADREDLYALAYTLAGLVFRKSEDKVWLRRRFEMLKDILETSWTYQEMVESAQQKGLQQGLENGLEKGLQQGWEKGEASGIEQGRVQTLRDVVVRNVEKRFPALTGAASRYVNSVNDGATLDALVNKLFEAQTSEEVAALFTRR